MSTDDNRLKSPCSEKNWQKKRNKHGRKGVQERAWNTHILFSIQRGEEISRSYLELFGKRGGRRGWRWTVIGMEKHLLTTAAHTKRRKVSVSVFALSTVHTHNGIRLCWNSKGVWKNVEKRGLFFWQVCGGKALTGPSLSSSRAQSYHLHLSDSTRESEWLICAFAHTQRCTHSLEQAEAHTGTVTQAATHKNTSLLHILSASSRLLWVLLPLCTFHRPAVRVHAAKHLSKDGPATIIVKNIHLTVHSEAVERCLSYNVAQNHTRNVNT